MGQIIIRKNDNKGEVYWNKLETIENDKSFLDSYAKVKIDYSGICGSDIHALHLADIYSGLKTPRVLGHEATGTIIEIYNVSNENSLNFEVGNKVVINPIISCGTCEMCKNGKTNLCLNRKLFGSDLNGFLQNFVFVPLNNLFKIDASSDNVLLAMVEPFAVALHSVNIAIDAGLDKDKDVIIFGAGKISLFIAITLKIVLNLKNIIIVGIERDNEVRLPLFRHYGFKTFLYNEVFDVKNKCINRSKLDKNFSIIFEVSGTDSGINGAIELVKSNGKIICIGLPESRSRIELVDIVRRELQIIGSDSYVKKDFEDAIKLIRGGIIDGDWIEILKPESCKKGFEDYESSIALGVLFNFTY